MHQKIVNAGRNSGPGSRIKKREPLRGVSGSK
jgi:hypothetical protein